MRRKKILIGIGWYEKDMELIEGYVIHRHFGIAKSTDKVRKAGIKFSWLILHLNTGLIITRAVSFAAARKFADQISYMRAFDQLTPDGVRIYLQEFGVPVDVAYTTKAMHDTDRVLYTNPFSAYEER